MHSFRRFYQKTRTLLWVVAVVCPLAESWGQGIIFSCQSVSSNSLTVGTGAPSVHHELKAEANRLLDLSNAGEEKESNTFAEVKGPGVLPDVLVGIVADYLDHSENSHNEFLALRGFFEVKGPVITKQYNTRQAEAQEEIKELIGEFKWIEPGSMIAGATPEEPNPWDNNLPQRYVEIKEGFGMPVTDVTVKNYKYLYDEKMDEATLKKPMRGLTRKQWVEYAAKLTTRLEKLFPIAYPGLKFREAKVPAEAEKSYIEYATTIPIEPRRVRFPKDSRKYVTITAEHSVYSGLNLIIRTGTRKQQLEDEAKLKRVADFGRYGDPDPADVDSVEPNPRGLKGLSGGVWKIINVDYNPYNVQPAPCLVVSGYWRCDSEVVRVCSRRDLFAEDAASWAGVRLVILFW